MSPEPIVVNLVVSGVDLCSVDILDTLAQRLDDLLWSESAGTVIATVFAQTDPVDAALDAARRIRCVVAGASVTRAHPDLVTTTAIADRVGVSRQAVHQWVTGRASTQFPEPYAVLEPEGKPVKVWRWGDVTPWLHAAKSLTFEPLPSPAQVASIDAQVSSIHQGGDP